MMEELALLHLQILQTQELDKVLLLLEPSPVSLEPSQTQEVDMVSVIMELSPTSLQPS